jgi:hypothetical protein
MTEVRPQPWRRKGLDDRGDRAGRFDPAAGASAAGGRLIAFPGAWLVSGPGGDRAGGCGDRPRLEDRVLVPVRRAQESAARVRRRAGLAEPAAVKRAGAEQERDLEGRHGKTQGAARFISSFSMAGYPATSSSGGAACGRRRSARDRAASGGSAPMSARRLMAAAFPGEEPPSRGRARVRFPAPLPGPLTDPAASRAARGREGPARPSRRPKRPAGPRRHPFLQPP